MIVATSSSGAPWWSAVVAALAGSVIVGVVSYLVAREERKAASERLDRQLDHDRVLRAQEIKSAADRLDRQLSDERKLRDIEHLRATLAPIARRVLDWNVVTSLRAAVVKAGSEPSLEQRTSAVQPLINQLRDQITRLAEDNFTLVIAVGPSEFLAESVRALIDALRAFSDLSTEWRNGTKSTEEYVAALDVANDRHNATSTGFVMAAHYAATGRELSPKVVELLRRSYDGPPGTAPSPDVDE